MIRKLPEMRMALLIEDTEKFISNLKLSFHTNLKEEED